MKRLSRLFIVPGLAVVGLLLASCAGPNPGNGVVSISKVNPYHLKPGNRIETEDKMIKHEQRYYLHGAVTSEQFQERFGHYFTVHWGTKEPGSPVTVRLDYTQGKTGPTIHSIESEVANPKRNNATKFRITGPEYRNNGPITSWKVSLVAGGQTAAESKSFLWK